jgi:hypothetical protein
MCKTCKTKFNVQEKIAEHDFLEQMYEFYGLVLPIPKKRKLTKKSLLVRIENGLMQLKKEQNNKYVFELEDLITKQLDIEIMNKSFQAIMSDYYKTKLKET